MTEKSIRPGSGNGCAVVASGLDALVSRDCYFCHVRPDLLCPPLTPPAPLPPPASRASPPAGTNPPPPSLPLLLPSSRPAVTFFGAGGSVTRGRHNVEAMYKGLCSPDAGLTPFHFEALESHRLGTTLYTRWRFTSPALSEPYDGADAYGTEGNQLVRVVSTFDVKELQFNCK